jgi:hypothetical protein
MAFNDKIATPPDYARFFRSALIVSYRYWALHVVTYRSLSLLIATPPDYVRFFRPVIVVTYRYFLS